MPTLITLGVMLAFPAGLPTPVCAQGDPATSAIPELGARVTRLRFFEGGKSTPTLRDRQYAVRFDSAAVRSIYVEIGLAYPPAKAPVLLRVECGYAGPGGTPAGNAAVEVAADAGWELSVHAGGTGTDAPGSWPAGAYQVTCRYAGKLIANGGFEIARPTPPPPAPKPVAARPSAKGAPKPTPRAAEVLPPATLGSAPFNGLKAKVTAIRFFESGLEAPDPKDRVITARFNAVTTRYINVELELEYPRALKQTSFEVACRFAGPDSTERVPLLKGTVEPGWIGSYHTAGFGAPARGVWPEGKYAVNCVEEGKVVAATTIEVFKPAPAIASLGASLLHLRFFQSRADRLPNEPRRYGSRFDSRTARWIKTEFALVYPAVPAPVTFAVECLYLFPDGTARPVRAERLVPAGWTGSVHAQGIGGDGAGHWPAGTYRVSCRSDGKEFAAGSFEVVDDGAVPPPTSGASLRFFGMKAGDSGPPAPAGTFQLGGFDSLMVEAVMPLRAAGDSTSYTCTLGDPSGVASTFVLKGEARDRSLVGAGAAGGADGLRMRGGYRVECRIGTKAASVADRFTITGLADIPSLDARVAAASLFEGGDTPPDDETFPDLSFSAARVRSLWLVALLDRPAPGAASLAWQCRVTGAKNAVFADGGAQATSIGAGDGAVVLRQRFLPLPKQKWVAGKYLVACTSGTATFLRLPFDLTK